jgi:hydrogenase maturation factor HypE
MPMYVKEIICTGAAYIHFFVDLHIADRQNVNNVHSADIKNVSNLTKPDLN